jgi:ELWxxDGT repeat protein
MKHLYAFLLVSGLVISPTLHAQTITLVKDINPTGRSNPQYFVGIRSGILPAVKNEVLFQASDGTHSIELWISDGTEDGTHMVKDINPGDGASQPQELTYAGNLLSGKVFFKADDGTHGYELWVTTGSEASTRMVADINPGEADGMPYAITSLNGKVVFVAGESAYGRELYISDGTEAGTRLLMDINPGTESSNPINLVAIGDQVWFSATDDTHGSELWVTDGTTINTNLIKNINTDANGSSMPQDFISFYGKVYFSANDGVHGEQIFVSDGTTAGTKMFKELGNGTDASPSGFTIFKNKLYFTATLTDGKKLIYRTDGTEEGTELFPAKQESEATGTSTLLTVFQNRLYFNMKTAPYGEELWSTDGTEAGTYLVHDIYPGSASSTPGSLSFSVMNSLLYFSAHNDENNISQVWITDGTSAGTRMIVPEIAPVERPLGYPCHFYVWNEMLFFCAGYTSHSFELWKITPPSTGVETTIPESATFEFWPNPVQRDLNIRCTQPVTLHVLDLSGRLLIEKTMIRSGTLSLNGLTPGLYFITDRERKIFRKLIVE